MPREDRRIIFSYEETYKAIYTLCAQREMKKPPPGSICEIVVDDIADDSRLTIKIENRQENVIHDREYSRDFLAAALMVYCRGLSIPISKKATKSVELKKDSVILRLVI